MYAQTAEHLGIPPGTVKSHVLHITLTEHARRLSFPVALGHHPECGGQEPSSRRRASVTTTAAGRSGVPSRSASASPARSASGRSTRGRASTPRSLRLRTAFPK